MADSVCSWCVQALLQDAVLKWKKVQSTHAGASDAVSGAQLDQEVEEDIRPKEDVRLLPTTLRASSYVPTG